MEDLSLLLFVVKNHLVLIFSPLMQLYSPLPGHSGVVGVVGLCKSGINVSQDGSNIYLQSKSMSSVNDA